MRQPQKISLLHKIQLLHTNRLLHKEMMYHQKIMLPHMMELLKTMRLPNKIRLPHRMELPHPQTLDALNDQEQAFSTIRPSLTKMIIFLLPVFPVEKSLSFLHQGECFIRLWLCFYWKINEHISRDKSFYNTLLCILNTEMGQLSMLDYILVSIS